MRLRAAFIFVFVLAIPAYSQEKCTTITDLESGITLCFPSDWKPRVRPFTEPGGPVLGVFLNDQVSGDTTFMVYYEPAGKVWNSTVDMIEQIASEAAKGDTANVKTRELLSSEDFVTTSGIQGKRVMMRLTYPQALAKFIGFVFKNETRSISIIALFEDTNQRMEKIADAIAKSLTIRQAPTTPTVPKSS